MFDQSSEFNKQMEWLHQTPVNQLTHTQLSNLINSFSNTFANMMVDGEHDFDKENVRQGFNNLFRYKAASYPDECIAHIMDMVFEESRNVPDDVYGNQTRRMEVVLLNKQLGFGDS